MWPDRDSQPLMRDFEFRQCDSASAETLQNHDEKRQVFAGFMTVSDARRSSSDEHKAALNWSDITEHHRSQLSIRRASPTQREISDV